MTDLSRRSFLQGFAAVAAVAAAGPAMALAPVTVAPPVDYVQLVRNLTPGGRYRFSAYIKVGEEGKWRQIAKYVTADADGTCHCSLKSLADVAEEGGDDDGGYFYSSPTAGQAWVSPTTHQGPPSEGRVHLWGAQVSAPGLVHEPAPPYWTHKAHLKIPDQAGTLIDFTKPLPVHGHEVPVRTNLLLSTTSLSGTPWSRT